MMMCIKVSIPLFSVIVVGDASVGKTNIIHCYSKGKIANNTMPTVGVEYASKIIPLRTNNG
jgi:GTPase SAR1 family protein